MNLVPLLLIIIGSILFYAIANMLTYSSFSLYGSITLLLLGLSVYPLIVKDEDETQNARTGSEQSLKKRRK